MNQQRFEALPFPKSFFKIISKLSLNGEKSLLK